MFSAHQLAKFAGNKRVSQETFDAAVLENIQDFDLEPQEALKSAVEEFAAQGVDLSNIIKTLTGGNITGHPAAQAVQRATEAARCADPEGAAVAADSLAALVEAAEGKEAAAEVAAVLHKAGAACALVHCVPACAGARAQELRVLSAIAVLLGSSRELQADFMQAHGVAALQQVLGQQKEDASLAAAALLAAVAVAAKNEEGKAALMAAGVGGSALEAMQRHAHQPEVLQAACDVLRVLTNPDDDTQPASRAFPNARALAKEGAAKQLVVALRAHGTHSQPVITALCNTLRQVAANEEVCQEVAAAGGVQLALHILEAGMSDVSIARPLCALLRQLVSSDGNKTLFVECGGLELLSTLLGVQGSSPAVLEQALGLLTNVTLRYPEAAIRASTCGCLDATMELMQVLLASNGFPSGLGNGKENRAPAVQRQACMAIRNAAVRSPEVRAMLLDKGAEALLRAVKLAYPSCAEAGAAALRDLGLQDHFLLRIMLASAQFAALRAPQSSIRPSPRGRVACSAVHRSQQLAAGAMAGAATLHAAPALAAVEAMGQLADTGSLSLALGGGAAIAALGAALIITDPQKRRSEQMMQTGGDELEAVKTYFDTTGFDRWNKIYGDTDEVNKVQLDIRQGHAQTVDKVLRWLDEEGGVVGTTVCDAGCGTGSLSIPLALKGAAVSASDISSSMASEAQRRYAATIAAGATPPEVAPKFETMDLESCSGRYHTVCCLDVMIHYPTDKMEGMVQHLASLADERLIISFAPNTLAYAILKRIGELFPGPSKATRAYLHKEEDVEAALAKAGFKVTKREMTATSFYFSRLLSAQRV